MPPMLLARPKLPRALTLLGLATLAALISGCSSREERIQNVQAEANAYLFENDSEKALETLRKGLAKFPDSNDLRIALARANQNAGNIEEAATLLEEAIEQDPEADQLWVKIGELRASLGQSEKAILAFESYLKNHAGDFLAWKTVALENEKLGKLTDAIKAAGKWNEITPSAKPALKLGNLYLASRNIAQARSWFSQAAAYDDGAASKEALAELIKLETSLKQFQQATVWLQKYAERYGDNVSDQRIQESKTVLENWERARREIAQAAAELDREQSELGDGEPNGSQTELTSAELTISSPSRTEPEPEPAEEQTSGGEVEKPPLSLFGEDDPPGAGDSAASGDSLALAPFERAVAAYEAGNYNRAIELFWELLGANSHDPQIWHRLSQAYYASENWYDAEATILEARRRAPRSEPIAHQYLLTIAKTQNANRALEEIKAVRALFPRSAPIALTLAQTLQAANAPSSIVSAAYRDFMELANRGAPGYREARQYLQKNN